jgi:hypothetical protein
MMRGAGIMAENDNQELPIPEPAKGDPAIKTIP